MRASATKIATASKKQLTPEDPKATSVQTIADRWQRAKEFVLDDPTAEEPFSFTLKHEMNWDDAFTELAIVEYKKFMVLSSLFPEDGMTPSLHIDTVWHMHLLYTRSYQRFCREVLNCSFLHHEPSTGGEEQEVMHKGSYRQTLDKYAGAFGMQPDQKIWGARIRPDLLRDELFPGLNRGDAPL